MKNKDLEMGLMSTVNNSVMFIDYRIHFLYWRDDFPAVLWIFGAGRMYYLHRRFYFPSEGFWKSEQKSQPEGPKPTGLWIHTINELGLTQHIVS